MILNEEVQKVPRNPQVKSQMISINFLNGANLSVGPICTSFKESFRLKYKICLSLQEAPNLYSYTLVGDHNLLNLALFDMKFMAKSGERIRQSGHCVSGLTIRGATERIFNMDKSVDRIIVNVGAVDIAEGRQLIQLIHDLNMFLKACDEMKITAVLTTLAPLPHHMRGNKKEILIGFNEYIRKCSIKCCVIDLYKGMTRNNGIDFHLYQPGPRYVSGSRQAFLLWNKLGRQRVHNMLMRNLGEAMLYENNFIGDYI